MTASLRHPFSPLFASLLIGALTAPVTQAQSLESGAVYTSTNETAANQVAIFLRAADGVVTFDKLVATGGHGTGAGLGNQGAVVLTQDERFLMVVNAGSNSISVFRVLEDGLKLSDLVPSKGLEPVSVAQHDDLVYVVNAGSDNIAGFRIDEDGNLDHISGSKRPLSGSGTAPAQIGFSPDGRYLFVTEKATNNIVRFKLKANGRPSKGVVTPSIGQTPFGFAFGFRNQLFVSEANMGMAGLGTVTSYQQSPSLFAPITLTAATNETATCWVVATNDGRFIYASNTGTDSVSSFRVGFEGKLELLNPQAANTGDMPLDMALSNDGRFFYVLNAGAGSIGDYLIGADASLISLPGSNSGLPSSASGLAAR